MQGRGSKRPDGLVRWQARQSPLMQGRGSKHDLDSDRVVVEPSPLMQGRGSKLAEPFPERPPVGRPSCRGVDRNSPEEVQIIDGTTSPLMQGDRKSVGWGRSVSVRLDSGGRGSIKKKRIKEKN